SRGGSDAACRSPDALDHAPRDDAVAFVEDERLSGGHGALWRVEADVGEGVVKRGEGRGRRLVQVSDLPVHWDGTGRHGPGRVGDARDPGVALEERPLPVDLDGSRRGVDLRHVETLLRRDLDAPSLTDG